MINLDGLKNITKGLIFDRTQGDVDYALVCERNGISTEENLRGAYNISDRNRVGEAVNFVIDCLKSVGVYVARPNRIRDDWNKFDIIVSENHRDVLDSLSNLKWFLPYSGTAEVPDSLDSLTFQKANAVESIIFDLYGVFSRLLDSWLYFGDGYMSEFDVWKWQGWDDAEF